MTTADKLNDVRTKIDNLDHRILDLLAERKKLSKEIIEEKCLQEVKVRDFEREQALIKDRVDSGRDRSLESHFVGRIFREILQDSVRSQHRYIESLNAKPEEMHRKLSVAFHGIKGSYCEIAAIQHFEKINRPLDLKGYSSFDEVIQAVVKGDVECAIIPVENSSRGGINEVFELLLNTNLFIVGEEKLKIEHRLLGLSNADIKSVKRVLCSHLTYLDCKDTIKNYGFEVEYFPESASAALEVSKRKDSSIVAIASEESAKQYGLKVLVPRMGANKDGVVKDDIVRSLIVAKNPRDVDNRIPAKTSLVFATPNEPGALANALIVFRNHNINLTKLESHPIHGNPWEEMFYVDFVGNIRSTEVSDAIKELTTVIRFLRVMGSYPTVDLDMAAYEERRPKANTVVEDATAKTKKSSSKSKSYSLASREHKESDTVIVVKGAKIGGDTSFCIMAGPCSVESEEQIMKCAKEAKETGVQVLRGGCFKPRTSPYSFQGLGFEGLKLLKVAGDTYDLPIITEVMAPEDVEGVAELSDMLQIGARNMQNFNLLKAVGATKRPVLLKRGMSSSIEDLLNAAEYVLAQGNQQLILCERGIRTFETATRSTLDLSAVPVLKRETHLPIIVDPSHAAGERYLVPPLSRAAKAIGSHGLIVEFHPEPEKALSDGPQALYFDQFREFMKELK
jgi:chorismate mutase / prephenate dehydratase